MPNWLGDAVMATPILTDLRLFYPDAKITAMCQGSVGQLLTHDPHLNEIFTFKRVSGWIHHLTHKRLTDPLKQGDYDLGILLPNSFSSACWFWRAGVEERIGFPGHWRRLLLTRAVPLPKEIETQHLVDTYKNLLEPLGIARSDTSPTLYVTPQEQRHAREQLRNEGLEPACSIIGINPGAAYGSAKCWLPERFREVALKLLEQPNRYIVFFGDPTTFSLVHQICEGLPSRVINLAGKTNLRQLLALIQCCDVFLTNDSGPMHIAAAFQIPLLALFGSTSDAKTGPYAFGKVIHKHVECSPCYKRVCDRDFRCMKRITSQEVYEEIEHLLDHSCGGTGDAPRF